MKLSSTGRPSSMSSGSATALPSWVFSATLGRVSRVSLRLIVALDGAATW
jgi:hypothetical protein